MKISCIGDSFVSGFGVSPHERWTTLLEEMMQTQVLNRGINGDTTAGMLARLMTDIDSDHPSIVFLSGGFNDCICGAPAEVAQGNMMAMIHQSYHKSITPVVIIAPHGEKSMFAECWPSFIDYTLTEQRYKVYREHIKELCRSFSVFYVDLFDLSERIEAHDIYLDGIHLNVKGHKLVAERIQNSLKKQGLFN